MTQLQQDTSPSSQESPIFSSPFKLSRLPKTWWEQLHGTQAVSVWEVRQLLLTWTRVPLGHKGWPAVSPRTAWSMPGREWSTAHCKFPIPCKNTSVFCKSKQKAPNVVPCQDEKWAFLNSQQISRVWANPNCWTSQVATQQSCCCPSVSSNYGLIEWAFASDISASSLELQSHSQTSSFKKLPLPLNSDILHTPLECPGKQVNNSKFVPLQLLPNLMSSTL